MDVSIEGLFRSFLFGTPFFLWFFLLLGSVLFGAVFDERSIHGFRHRFRNMLNGLFLCLVFFLALPGLHVLYQLVFRYVGFLPLRAGRLSVVMYVVVLFGYFVVMDLFYYWWHRSQHFWLVLWRLHAVHHSDSDLSASTYVRQHFSELLFQAVLINIPLMVLFGRFSVPLTVVWFFTFWNFFIHGRFFQGNSSISRFVTTPLQHRCHHSMDPAYYNTNFAAYFSFWDVLFGTYRHPDGLVVSTGLDGDNRYISGFQMNWLWRDRVSR